MELRRSRDAGVFVSCGNPGLEVERRMLMRVFAVPKCLSDIERQDKVERPIQLIAIGGFRRTGSAEILRDRHVVAANPGEGGRGQPGPRLPRQRPAVRLKVLEDAGVLTGVGYLEERTLSPLL